MIDKFNSNLLEVVGDAGFVVEWIDCKTGRFLQVNEYSSVMHDMKKEEIEGMLLWELDPLFSPERFFDLVELLREKKRFSLETEHKKKDGTVFPIEVNISYRGEEDGNPEHFIAFIKDISERKDMEKALVQKNAELEELIYRISHDVRAPLQSIKPLVNVMTSSMEAQKFDVACKAATHVALSVNKLGDFVEDLLRLARASKLEEDEQSINVGLLVKEALEKFENMESFDRLDLRHNLNFSDSIVVKPSRLRMIVENLISNAIKYQDNSKDDPYISIVTDMKGGEFVFEVRDNGLGVPKEHQDELFQMFKRFHPDASFGSGLGLYMMKKCADILGGALEFEDAGDGSIFRFRMPLESGACH